MSQPELLVLARQGNVEAIATLMDRKLASAGIHVEARLDRHCLHLALSAPTLPDRPALMTFVRKGMAILKVDGITEVEVSGWQTGQSSPSWRDHLQLAPDGSGMSLAATSPSPQPPSNTTYSFTHLPPDRINPNLPPLPEPEATAPDRLNFDPGAEDLPEQQYAAWLRETGQLGGLAYRWGLNQLAAYLVYFLTPGEELLDVTAVRMAGQPSVLLLSDRRLAALSMPLPPLRQAVVEHFSYPRSSLTRVGSSRLGLSLEAEGNHHRLTYDNPTLSAAFVNRSLARAIDLEVAAEPISPSPSPDDRRLLWVGLGSVGGLYGVILLCHWLLGSTVR